MIRHAQPHKPSGKPATSSTNTTRSGGNCAGMPPGSPPHAGSVKPGSK
jgi:hypothetical protein